MKNILFALFVSLFVSAQGHAYLIECKGINDETQQARFIQQESGLDVNSQIQKMYETGGFTARLKMNGANVEFINGLPSKLQWSNNDYLINLVISNDILREDPKVRPFGFKSKFTFVGSGNTIIDSDDFVCRYFQM